tara:strand:+ start:4595 stop:4726 length:132 start_codon:yes stop_codon:yes gene_type:complete
MWFQIIRGVTVSIDETIYFNDGNGYFDNNNLLGLPDSSAMLTI